MKNPEMRSIQGEEANKSRHDLEDLANMSSREASDTTVHGVNSSNKNKNHVLLRKEPRSESHFGNMTDNVPSKSDVSNEDESILTADTESSRKASKDGAMGSDLETLQEARRKALAGNGCLSIIVRHKWVFLLSSIFLVILLCWIGQEGGESIQENKTAAENIQFEVSTSMHELSEQTKQTDSQVDELTGVDTDSDTPTSSKVTSNHSLAPSPTSTSSPSPYPSFIWGNHTEYDSYLVTKPPLITKPPTDPPATSKKVSKKQSKKKSSKDSKSSKKTHPTPSQTTSQTSSPSSEGDLSGLHHTFQGKKPNFLVILADDVGTGDLPFYWQSSLVHMPHLSRLSKMGVTFMDAHSTPLCAPSRYMFLSGNYQHRGRSFNGRWNLAYSNNQFQPHQKSIAEVLRDQAGYHTAMFGKWHLGAKVPPHGLKDRDSVLTSSEHDWSQQLIDGPQDIGFDKSYITTGGIQFPPYSFFRNGYLTTNTTKDTRYWYESKYFMPGGISEIIKGGEGDKDWDTTAYNQILVKETQQFIENHIYERPNDPFFAYVGLGSVHLPHSPPYKYTDGSPIKGVYPSAHMDVLYELDKVVGSLVSTIEDNGLTKDTVIIFTSDNGGLPWDSNFFHHSSGPLRGHKGKIWEGGHRVPMIIRYPFFPSGEKRDQLVGLNDLYATICELVGIRIPFGSAQDSVSFAKLLYSRNNLSNARTSLATWDYKSGILEAEAIRFNNLKLIRHVNPPKIEVYDLGSDISEQNDISRYIPSYMKNNMLKELNELGPCPDDHTGYFGLRNGQLATCGFFRTNSQEKCLRYPEGVTNCNSVCGRHRKMCQDTIDSVWG